MPGAVSQGLLQDVTPLLKSLSNRGFLKSFVTPSMGGRKFRHYYIPWMKATYVMAVNKKALKCQQGRRLRRWCDAAFSVSSL